MFVPFANVYFHPVYGIPSPPNKEQVQVPLEKLEQMVDNISPGCVNLLDEILAIPGTEELAGQIENYDVEAVYHKRVGIGRFGKHRNRALLVRAGVRITSAHALGSVNKNVQFVPVSSIAKTLAKLKTKW